MIEEHTFPVECRIRRGSDFQRAYQSRQRVSDGRILLFGIRNELGISRIGLSVSRKHGNAVERNRRKRLLREAFRLTRSRLPAGYDFILIPQQGVEPVLAEYQKSLLWLANKLDQKYGAKT